MSAHPSGDREEQLLLAHHAAASPTLRYSAIHPVNIDGWLAKEGKALRSRRTRYLRLNSHILSSHRSKSATPSWQISVADAVIEKGSHPREIKISLPHRSISLVAPTLAAFHTWIIALRRASLVSSRVDDYYTIGRLIGEGMNGQVRLAQDILTDETVAIKMVPRLGRENETQFLAREVQIILSVNHPNIVNTIDVFVTRRRIHFVMEYLAGGELFDFIAENTHFTETHAATVMCDLLNALSYLHSRGIAHRDVKLENLLCANSTWPLNVKLADFGFANYVNSANEPVLSSFVGTPYYIAPEMLRSDPHGRPVDIWAGGVVLYILLSGKFPFGGKNESEYYQRVLYKQVYFPTDEWASVSAEAKDLVRGMLCKDPQKRLTADECLRHPWLKRARGATPVCSVRETVNNELFPPEGFSVTRSEVLLSSATAFRSNREKRGRWRQRVMLNHSLPRNAETGQREGRRERREARPSGMMRMRTSVSTTAAASTTGVLPSPPATATANTRDDSAMNRRPSLIRRLLSSGKLSLDRYDGRFPSFRGSVDEAADEASATPRKTLSLFAKDGPLRRSFHRVGERVVEQRGLSSIGGSVVDGGINFVNSQSQRLPPKVVRERQRLQKQQVEANRKAGRNMGGVAGIFSAHRKWAGIGSGIVSDGAFNTNTNINTNTNTNTNTRQGHENDAGAGGRVPSIAEDGSGSMRRNMDNSSHIICASPHLHAEVLANGIAGASTYTNAVSSRVAPVPQATEPAAALQYVGRFRNRGTENDGRRNAENRHGILRHRGATGRYDNDVEFSSVVHQTARRETESSQDEDAVRRTMSAEVSLGEWAGRGSNNKRNGRGGEKSVRRSLGAVMRLR